MSNGLKFLSLALMGLSAGVALFFFAIEDGSGFLAGIGYYLGGLALAAGVLLIWPINGVLLRRRQPPRWVKVVFWLQTPAVLVMLGMAVSHGLDVLRDQRRDARSNAVLQAVQDDDVVAFDAAAAACDADCRQLDNAPAGWLYRAADAGSLKVAARLLAPPHGAPDTPYSGQLHSANTCDDRSLNLSVPLEAAVMRNHRAMIDLLLRTASDDDRRRAMWLAAELDRLALVQHMHQAGVSLQWRGRVLDENDTLLVAAAEGAALRVGHWLLASQGFSARAPANGPDPYPGTEPLQALFSHERDFDNPEVLARTRAFAQLLLAHGAEIDQRWSDQERSALDEAVRVNDRAWIGLLLDLGANRLLLPAERQVQLAALLARPPREPLAHTPDERCIALGD